jgi:hypothetical protein
MLSIPAARAQVYVSEAQGSVLEFDATTGSNYSAFYINIGGAAYGLALSGSNLYVLNANGGPVGLYNAITGATINSNFITGNIGGEGLALSGNNLFVPGNAGLGEYAATTGTAINVGFGPAGTAGAAVVGNNLYVTDFNSVVEIDATTGAVINSSFITGLSPFAYGLAASGNSLFVAVYPDHIGKYDATTGAAINTNFISGLNQVEGLAASGNDLYAVEFAREAVGKYDATTGAAINTNFITGLVNPAFVTVAPPSPTPLLTILAAHNQAVVSWPASMTNGTLQTNSNLATTNWADYAGTVTNNSVTNPASVGNLFFRLINL